MSANLPQAAPAVAAFSDKSIAVLPFTDMSEKKDQEYFADGMAEEIIDLLVKIPGIKVTSSDLLLPVQRPISRFPHHCNATGRWRICWREAFESPETGCE